MGMGMEMKSLEWEGMATVRFVPVYFIMEAVTEAAAVKMPTYLADDIHPRGFGTVCLVACEHLTSVTNILIHY